MIAAKQTMLQSQTPDIIHTSIYDMAHTIQAIAIFQQFPFEGNNVCVAQI